MPSLSVVRRALIASTILAACTAGTALAQEAAAGPANGPGPTNTQGPVVGADAPGGTVPSANAANSGIADIVVTAQRRSESLQKSSLAIQVLDSSAVQRAGATTANDLNALVPGVTIAAVGPTVNVFLRGVGDATTNPLGNSAISVNVDGVYVGRSTSISSNFYDISRIEVLKGPQGTLYGRNSSGGALNIITQAPKLGVVEGFVEGEAGNYDLLRGTGAINVPLGDTFAIRGAFQVAHHDGYLSEGENDQKDQEGRIRALWKPSEDFSVLLNFDAAHQGGRSESVVILPLVDPGHAWTSVNDPKAVPLLKSNPVADIIQGRTRQDNHFINVSAEVNWNFGPATLTVIPAFRHTLEDFTTWNGFRYGQHNNADQTSVEARLSNNSAKLKWVLGGYYFDEDQDVFANPGTSTLVQNITLAYVPKTRAYAAFGEATYSLTDRLRVIGGIRYTSERKTINGQTRDFSMLFGDPVNGRLAEIIAGSQKFTKVTWKGGAEFDLTPDSLLFFTASRGFKSGGLNPTAAPNAYRPEVLTAYTLGSRNRFLDNRLQVNIEAFYWDYKDKQEGAIGITPAGNISFLTSNAASAKLKGVSVDILAKPTSNDIVSLFAEYNHAKYGKFIYPIPTAFFSPANVACPFTPGPVFTQVDCSGRQLIRAPLWSGSASYQHRFDLASGANVTFNADARYSSAYWLAGQFVDNQRTAKYVTANATLTFMPFSKRWSVTGFVRNISDHAVYTQAAQLPLQGPASVANIAPPRTYGGRFRFNF